MYACVCGRGAAKADGKYCIFTTALCPCLLLFVQLSTGETCFNINIHILSCGLLVLPACCLHSSYIYNMSFPPLAVSLLVFCWLHFPAVFFTHAAFIHICRSFDIKFLNFFLLFVCLMFFFSNHRLCHSL